MTTETPPRLTEGQVSALQVLLRVEETKSIIGSRDTVRATSAPSRSFGLPIEVHINTARSLATKGLVVLTRFPEVRGLYAEDSYTSVELTEAGREAARPHRVPLPVRIPGPVRVVTTVELRLAALKLHQLSMRLDTSTVHAAKPVIEMARKINAALAVHERPRKVTES